MNLIEKHYTNQLNTYIDSTDTTFETYFNEIISVNKEDYKNTLKYLHSILKDNARIEKEFNSSNKLHVHFDTQLSDSALYIIAQYLIIRNFYQNSNKASTKSKSKIHLYKQELASRSRKLRVCPEGAGTSKGKIAFKKWKTEKKINDSHTKFFKNINTDIETNNTCLVNCQVSLANNLYKSFLTKPYAIQLDQYSKIPACCVINTNYNIDELDTLNSDIIDNLNSVIVFNCEEKNKMSYFSYPNLENYDLDISEYIIITHNINPKYNQQTLTNKLQTVHERFKINLNEKSSYIITNCEYKKCINSSSIDTKTDVIFIGNFYSEHWEDFLENVRINDLYELKSIKLINIYSLCFNEEIKNYILHDIFTVNRTAILISADTKHQLSNLKQEDLESLKQSLSQLLDEIINIQAPTSIKKFVNDDTVFVVDYSIIKLNEFIDLISPHILVNKNKFIAWSDLSKSNFHHIVILSYQDPGNFPYYFYPNLMELPLDPGSISIAVLNNFLLKSKYHWAQYNFQRNYIKLLNHPIREEKFKQNLLNSMINRLKPQYSIDIEWDIEQFYNENTEREVLTVTVAGSKARRINESELYIYSNNKKRFRVKRLIDIYDSFEKDEDYYVQNLNEIQQDFNIFEHIVDTKELDDQLQLIREKHNIHDMNAGRLWKILLAKQAEEIGVELLYEKLDVHLKQKRLNIVSFSHFCNNWITPLSDSIAPINKKVFAEICTFLELPKIYYIIIQKIRNTSKEATRNSTQLMNNLLSDLFRIGCFDLNKDYKKIIQRNYKRFKQSYYWKDLESYEIATIENLKLLVELIKPEIKVFQLKGIKK